MAEGNRDLRLLRLVQRVELIDDEIADRQQDRRDVIAEVKAMGYDGATFRKLIARRKLSPAERAEADAMLEMYEAAVDGSAPAAAMAVSSNLDRAAALLAEQLDGMEDPERAEALRQHILARLDIRAEIAELRRADLAAKKAAGADGFDENQNTRLVRWYEKIAQHGLEAMQLGEKVFGIYRATVDELGGPVRPDGQAPTADEKLAALFGKPAPKAPSAKARAISDAVAMARLNRAPGGGR